MSDKSAESAVRRVLGIDSAEGLRLVNVQVRTLNFPSGQKQYVVVKMTNTLETIKFLKSIGESSGDSDYFPIIARINPLANLSDAPDIDLLFVAVTYDTLKGGDPIIYMRNLYGPTGDITTNDTRLYTQPAGEQRPPLLQSPLWTPTPKPAP